MTKDEAIKILSLHLMQCGMMMPIGWLNNHGEGSDFMKAYEMALDALKNEPVQEWISVKDRLPKDNSNVIACLWIGEESRVYPAFYAHGVWWDRVFSTPTTNTTTHWQPMPQPPKGE